MVGRERYCGGAVAAESGSGGMRLQQLRHGGSRVEGGSAASVGWRPGRRHSSRVAARRRCGSWVAARRRCGSRVAARRRCGSRVAARRRCGGRVAADGAVAADWWRGDELRSGVPPDALARDTTRSEEGAMIGKCIFFGSCRGGILFVPCLLSLGHTPTWWA